MSIKIINLNKLLRLCALPQNELISALRDDLRSERNKMLGKKSRGGHFHHPWWDVAKGHVVGTADLEQVMPLLLAVSDQRKRLYPLLTKAFLLWLEEFRRLTNLPISVSEEEVHNHYPVPGLDLTVKVDNLLALRLGADAHRLIYPYFSEDPALAQKWARVGLWLMQGALPKFETDQMEILDVLRSQSFRGVPSLLTGDEEAVFRAKYLQIVLLWNELRPDYDLAA